MTLTSPLSSSENTNVIIGTDQGDSESFNIFKNNVIDLDDGENNFGLCVREFTVGYDAIVVRNTQIAQKVGILNRLLHTLMELFLNGNLVVSHLHRLAKFVPLVQLLWYRESLDIVKKKTAIHESTT
jgi:hypothetical protein